MKRYSTTRRKIDKSGIRVLSTTYYPEISIGNSDRFIMSKDGDRLDGIAFRYYSDATLWWVIAQANGLGKGRTILNPNFKIRIPGNIETILSDYNKLNS